ncbi:PREDICTED: LOW QUALITY PROTEIN: interleukin-1 receptor-like 2 [Elephantulus edwardii]|uniref:LOW QUALITY PROTEIN: interleukin-1 receptor-like 2 n=1 Tax=Elephantulus edwardii TaxID=28737 RepID=UPI0003F0D291|nr:PREDICTED: LOW QUALITY PROTEIN: interleukin-1 receptor-like 2 [Elephantulus edwardii]
MGMRDTALGPVRAFLLSVNSAEAANWVGRPELPSPKRASIRAPADSKGEKAPGGREGGEGGGARVGEAFPGAQAGTLAGPPGLVASGMEMSFWLLCGLSLALTPIGRADECKEVSVKNETISVDQPYAFNCTHPPQTLEEVNITWYKNPSKTPISRSIQSRIRQDQSWILFLPLTSEDSGIYQCVIKNINSCHRIYVNLAAFRKSWCGDPQEVLPSLSDEYIQTLHFGKDDILTCHLNFPKSCVLDLIKWYKDCEEINEEQEHFKSVGRKLLVKNVSEEDEGKYACQVRLTHAGKEYTVLNSISVDVTEKVLYGDRIPKITYPRNNSIEVKLGSPLTVACNITDVWDNTNLRCWKVNNTQVDLYYRESKRIKEGYESFEPFGDYYRYTVNITFLEVKMEDYDRPFVCHAGVSAAYVVLKLPVRDSQGYLIGGFIALAGVVASVMFIYNVFKIDIVLWYRSTFHSPGTMDDGKLYDAYVLYPKPQSGSQHHDMHMLVLKILPDVLEKQCGYKLFIFGRDEVPGQAVASVIDENIKLCRRLIIIIIPESLHFGLLKNMSEEQITVYNALIQDGMKVILIELEKIKDYTNMPESIKYIRQKHGAIQWHGHFTKEAQSAKTKFWKNVRYHMPPTRYPPLSPVQVLKRTPCNWIRERATRISLPRD